MSQNFPFEEPQYPNQPKYHKRLAMGVEYQGNSYKGWQIQKAGVSTIQETLEKAISTVADHPVSTIVAGRTDTGVHATNQVIHFDTYSDRDTYGWTMGVNSMLPDTMSIRWSHVVDENFHARFSATERAYRFVIHNCWIKSALLNQITTWERYALDESRMQLAANRLIGTHDFSSFRASECQAHSPVRTVRELTIERYGEFVVIQIKADGFLHHMIRNIVGVLLPIGQGRKPIEWVDDVLNARDRRKAGITAKGGGLYFVRAKYDIGTLPENEAGPSFIQPLINAIGGAFQKV